MKVFVYDTQHKNNNYKTEVPSANCEVSIYE